ncbi:MAG: DUF2062 domain-containing protein [Nitrospirae bacterium]|nr:DUF2062 domain-containing protein [Nitrospirota bacterium]
MGFKAKLREIIRIKDTPHRIAISFAMGIFIGMSPFFGFHTIGAFALAWLLRLNKFAAVVGVYITNPLTIIPIYTFSLWFGAKLTGMEEILPDIDWNQMTFIYLLDKLSPLILPFFVGTTVLGLISAAASYYIIHKAVTNYSKNRPTENSDK